MIKHFLIILLVIPLTLSGCFFTPQNKNTNTKVIPAETGIQEQNEIDTSEWQTYRNEEYGFEFKYPKDWTIIEQEDPKAGVALRSPEYTSITSGEVIFDGEIYVKRFVNNLNLTIIDFIDSFSDGSRFWPEQFSFNSILINNNHAIVFEEIKESDNFLRKQVFVSIDNRIISASYFYKEKNIETDRIFGYIVSSANTF